MANFPHEHLQKSHLGKYTYDRAQVSADLRAMADANDRAEITLITRRVTPSGPSSADVTKQSSCAFLEWEHS